MSAVLKEAQPLAVRKEFGGSLATLATPETASSAAAAQAKAMVEARYVMALRNPRNLDQVRQDLMAECKRPAFANNKSAWYIKPIGDGVEGLGIRFVEVALRCMKNILVETTMIFEDDTKEIYKVTVTDLESNLTYPLDVRVSKTVERSKPMSDGSYISVRKNSYGRDVFTIPGTDDELLNKRGALISKAIRTLGLRVVPGDMQDEAETIIKKIRLNEAAVDPGAERKRIADGFAEIGVKVSELVDYIGHSLDTCSPAELVKLRGVYGAIKEGDATWKEVMDNKATQGDGGGAGGGGDTRAPTTWPEAAFAESIKKWTKLVADKKKTPDQIIAMATTKHPLTDAQKKAILALAPPAEGVVIASADDLATIRDKAGRAEISEADIFKKFGIKTLDGIPAAQVPLILKFISDPAGA